MLAPTDHHLHPGSQQASSAPSAPSSAPASEPATPLSGEDAPAAAVAALAAAADAAPAPAVPEAEEVVAQAQETKAAETVEAEAPNEQAAAKGNPLRGLIAAAVVVVGIGATIVLGGAKQSAPAGKQQPAGKPVQLTVRPVSWRRQ